MLFVTNLFVEFQQFVDYDEARKGMWRRMFSFRQSGSEDPKPEETTSTPEEAPLKREESKNITGPFSTSPQENIKILKNSIRT
jgi:hypothetical protein